MVVILLIMTLGRLIRSIIKTMGQLLCMPFDLDGKGKGITFYLALIECFLRAPSGRAFEELAANFTCNNIHSFESGRINLSKAVAAVALLLLAKANLGFISSADGQLFRFNIGGPTDEQ